MIYNYPYNRNYYNKYNIYQKHNSLQENHTQNNISENFNFEEKISETKNTLISKDEKNTTLKTEDRYTNDDDTIINIFGIKLGFDDLLILGLLYLLYQEEVKDISLYIILILLLLN